jgi:hypothetical protein
MKRSLKSDNNYFSDNGYKQQVINCFIGVALPLIDPKHILYFKNSPYNLFTEFCGKEVDKIRNLESLDHLKKYDIIIGDFSVESKSIDFETKDGVFFGQSNWRDLYQSLNFLSDSGIGIFLLGPFGFAIPIGRAFETVLNNSGFFVNAYLNLPEKILEPESSLKPILALISHNEEKAIFVADIFNNEQAKKIASHLFLNKPENSKIDETLNSNYIEKSYFYDIVLAKINSQMDGLVKQHSFEKIALFDAVREIRNIEPDEKFQDEENTIYVPKHGELDVIYTIADAQMEHYKYFQVFLTDIVSNRYLTLYLNTSSPGKSLLSLLTSGSTNIVTSINRKEMGVVSLSLPKINEQKKILDTFKKIDELKSAIRDFEMDLAINPFKSKQISRHVNGMLGTIYALSDADKIRGLISDGESKTVEFKETLSLNARRYELDDNYSPEKENNSKVEESVLKTVVAFLNSNGGTLLVGVNDNGVITGLKQELDLLYKGNQKDGFLKHLKNLFKDKIGEEYYPFIETKIVFITEDDMSEKDVLIVECRPSKSPCYLDRKDFFVRTNPATDKLEGPKLIEYVRNHFNS